MNARPYAEVIGDPIAHSKSPLIHNFWLEKLGIDAEYRRMHVRAEGLEDYFAQRRQDPDWRGCNVTLPHKIMVLQHLMKYDESLSSVGAANMVVPGAGALTGYNTDVAGILEALPVSLMPAVSTVCLIGTGGAARAALAAFRQRNVARVSFSARNRGVAEALQAEFGFDGRIGPLTDAGNFAEADVIVNATGMGMSGSDRMPPALLELIDRSKPGATVFDMVYAPLETPLLAAARAHGLTAVDGLRMLVGQAAAAFELFFGQSAPRAHDSELRALLTA